MNAKGFIHVFLLVIIALAGFVILETAMQDGKSHQERRR